ncbi:hypothetical protein [Natrinema gelatinilyticum]|uniref:hypothetical protein n=1 Tax=Natrinema gelatinilyticum TaxID=2961571 RepID=UPI0020C56B74|nr:hypothetical protein [Natrinema gelatinilyticum]
MTSSDQELSAANLYVCEYDGGKTIAPGGDINLWNEGLETPLTVRRDFGQIEHSWIVLEAGVRKVRTEHVTDDGKLVRLPVDGQMGQPSIVHDVDSTVSIPTELFPEGHLQTAVRTSISEGGELATLAEDLDEISAEINRNAESAFRSRYEEWIGEQVPYPKGTNQQYEIPLDVEWKRDVIKRSTELTDAQATEIARMGFPSTMRVTVNVEYPEGIE